MWLQKADLVGLAVGFAIGGAALVVVLPRVEALLAPVSVTPPAAPPMQSLPPGDQALAPPAPTEVLPAPAPMPRIAEPDLPQPDPAEPRLPAVIRPTRPPAETGKPGTGKAGTGFFVADDGSLLTAAHVVTACRRTEIVSRFVKPTPVDVLAIDTTQDIALLQAPHLHPPGTLPLGRPASHRLLVLGYPATAGPIIPEETAAILENDKLPPGSGPLADPRQIVWIEATAVTHGYSGGPILDLASGSVVGLVKGVVDGNRLRFVHGMPTSGVSIGPGAGRLGAFLRQMAPDLETAQPYDTGDAAVDDARRATVHVICWF